MRIVSALFLCCFTLVALSASSVITKEQPECTLDAEAIIDHIMEVRSPPLLELGGLTKLYVVDFGAIPDNGENDYGALQAAVSRMHELGGNVELVFSPGTYILDPGGGIFQTNEPPCILINELKNVVVDGQGAEIIIKRPSVSFCRVRNSENVIVRNFSIDYDPLPFTQGVVTNYHPDGLWIDVLVDDGFPMPDDAFFHTFNSWSMFKDPDIPGKLKHGVPNHFRWESFQVLDERLVRVNLMDGHPERIKNRFSTGDRYAQVGRSAGGCAYYESNHVTFQNLTYYACPSSLFSGSTTSHLNIINCKAKIKDNRLLVNGADGVHCQAARIGPWIEGCEFEGLSDDCLNIYATPTYVTEIIDSRKLTMTATNRMQVGDSLVFFRPQTGELIAKVRIESIHNSQVTLSQPVTGLNIALRGVPFDHRGWKIYDHAYNLNAIGNYFVYRNNHMRNGRRYAALIKASYGLIENNRFENLSDCAICIQNTPDWPEGFWARNIVIRNNQMLDCAFMQNRSPVEISFRKLNGTTAFKMQKNIILEGNHIRAGSGPVMHISAVDGLVLKDNVLETNMLSDPLAVISNTTINCMSNNTDEHLFEMTQVDYTGLPSLDDQGRLLIFPNPAGSHIYIRHIDAVHDARAWSINDSLGRIFLNGTLPAGAEQLDINVASLKKGLYNLNLYDGQGAIFYAGFLKK